MVQHVTYNNVISVCELNSIFALGDGKIRERESERSVLWWSQVVKNKNKFLLVGLDFFFTINILL